jgi:hypothetical protein
VGAHSTSYPMLPGTPRGYSCRGVKLNSHPYITSRLTVGGAMPISSCTVHGDKCIFQPLKPCRTAQGSYRVSLKQITNCIFTYSIAKCRRHIFIKHNHHHHRRRRRRHGCDYRTTHKYRSVHFPRHGTLTRRDTRLR